MYSASMSHKGSRILEAIPETPVIPTALNSHDVNKDYSQMHIL